MNYDAVFRSRRSNVLATRGMVAASHPLAAQAGLDMLKAGGSAADAAIATAAMLGVVEPQSTGIGGDCFALYWDAQTKTVSALNGSGKSPAAASVDELRRLGYSDMPSFTGHSVNVPGTVAGWSDLLDRFGRMTLAEVLQPAIWTAEEGFPVTEWIAHDWAEQVPKLRRDPDWQSGDLDNGPEQPSGHEFLIEGRSPRLGEVMRLPTLAETMRGLAADGKAYIYQGDFARRAADHVQRYGGWLTAEDMAAHSSSWETPLSTTYRDVTLYECPPNGQGLAAILAVNLASGFDLAAMSEADRVHTMLECMRLGFADAEQWVCDPEQFDIPLSTLLSEAYTTRRRARIKLQQAAQEVPFGELKVGHDTVYLSVVDGEGNACSFINSISAACGSGLVVPGTGVILQNRAAGFLLTDGHPNQLGPSKRSYHTIIPAMTTRDGELHAAYGVMGGRMQPQGHFQMLVNLVDLDLNPQHALDLPRWRLATQGDGLGATQSGGLVYLEEDWSLDLMAELARRGHRIAPVTGFERGLFGGGQIILRNPATGVLIAGSEPRKDGCAVGY